MSDMTKKQCEAAAKRLAKTLGEGWTPSVWDNIGWYYCAQKGGNGYDNGSAAVYPLSDNTFWCTLVTTKQFTCEDNDPVKAFKAALAEATNDIKNAQAVLKQISE